MKPTRLVPALFTALLAGCMSTEPEEGPRDAGTNSETKTTLQARFFLPDGSPAAQATATWLPYCSGCQAQTTTVGADGAVADSGIPKGYLGLLLSHPSGNRLFQDSILSDGRRTTTLSDTLRPPSIVKGRIVLRRGDTLRTSLARILGVDFLGLAARDGRFRIERVPAGRYTLEASNQMTGYLPTFRTFRVGPGDSLDLGDIVLLSTLPPQAPEIRIHHDTLVGAVDLRWDRVDDDRIAEIRIRTACRVTPLYQGWVGFFQDTLRIPAEDTSARVTIRAATTLGMPAIDTCTWSLALIDSAGTIVSEGTGAPVLLPTPALANGFSPRWTRLATVPDLDQKVFLWGESVLCRTSYAASPLVLKAGTWANLFEDASEGLVASQGDTAWTWSPDCETCDSGRLRLRLASGPTREWRLPLADSVLDVRVVSEKGRIWVGFFGRRAFHGFVAVPDSLRAGFELLEGSSRPGAVENWKYGKSHPWSTPIQAEYRSFAASEAGGGWWVDWWVSSLQREGEVRLGPDPDDSVVLFLDPGGWFRSMGTAAGSVWIAAGSSLHRSVPGKPERFGIVTPPLAGGIGDAAISANRIVVRSGHELYEFDPRTGGVAP